MNMDLLPRLREFAERVKPEWQIVLEHANGTDLIITRDDLRELVELATAENRRRALLDMMEGR